MDILPNDILNNIYKIRHELEMENITTELLKIYNKKLDEQFGFVQEDLVLYEIIVT